MSPSLLTARVDYEQYYASLAASNAASAQATPSGLGSEEVDSEEEQKRSSQYSEALNGYRKRSRSQDDEGTALKKTVKLEVEPPDRNGLDHQEAENGRGADGPLVSGTGYELDLVYVVTHLLFISKWCTETVF